MYKRACLQVGVMLLSCSGASVNRWVGSTLTCFSVGVDGGLSADSTPYEVWSYTYGLSGDDADEKADVENGGLGDGLDNLMEYALGGNPTNDDAAAVSPDTFMAEAHGTDWFYPVHNRNTDTNLTFTVGATPDLVATAGSN
jgi:hypothetical protein